MLKSFVRSFVRSFVPSFIHSFIHSFIRSFIHSFTRSFIHSLVHSFIHSLVHSFIHSVIHSLVHSFIHSFIHSVIHSLVHSFIHSFIHSSVNVQHRIVQDTHIKVLVESLDPNHDPVSTAYIMWAAFCKNTSLSLSYQKKAWLAPAFFVMTPTINRVPSVRENQGESGKIFFFWKVREFCSEVNQISTLIQMHFFLKPDVYLDFFASLHSAF